MDSRQTEAAAAVPEEICSALGLEKNVDAHDALRLAEERLKTAEDGLKTLSSKHPSLPKHKRDQQRFQPIVIQLRAMVHGRVVDELCDKAEAALDATPPSKANAREFLRQARVAGKTLAEDSDYMLRVQSLEERLKPSPAAPAAPSALTPAIFGGAEPPR